MRYALSSDMHAPIVDHLLAFLRARDHTVEYFGPQAGEADGDWPTVTLEAARRLADGRVDQAIVLCWTGTGASICANKVAGVRCALVTDAETARGARRWNDANALALSIRRTTPHVAEEILTAWWAQGADDTPWNRTQLARIAALDATAPSSPS